jgi:hypothetical protein
MKSLILIFLILLMTGCAGPRPLRPGQSTVRSSVTPKGVPELMAEMKQSENPAQAASQNFERITETELPVPARSLVQEIVVTPAAQPGFEPERREKTIIVAEPTLQKTRTVEKVGTTVGAAQKDTAREIGAKLGSLRGIVWVGMGLFVFGLASLVYPPLRLLVGSVTTSLAALAGGVALMVLPTLVVGHELVILAAVGASVGIWFLAHRHGQLRGMVDANKNGIDDSQEGAGNISA